MHSVSTREPFFAMLVFSLDTRLGRTGSQKDLCPHVIYLPHQERSSYGEAAVESGIDVALGHSYMIEILDHPARGMRAALSFNRYLVARLPPGHLGNASE